MNLWLAFHATTIRKYFCYFRFSNVYTMAKAVLKTQKTEVSVTDYLNAVKDEGRRKDCFTLVELMEKATNAKAKMWGPAIVGFGDAYLKYESGRELDWFLTGFASRKASLSLYVMCAAQETALLKKLGKHKMTKGCLYINTLADVDLKVLNELIRKSTNSMKKMAEAKTAPKAKAKK